MRKVVRDLDPFERRRQRHGVQQIGGDDAGARKPRGKRPRVPAHEDKVVAARRQEGNQSRADVSAGAHDQDPHAASMRPSEVRPGACVDEAHERTGDIRASGIAAGLQLPSRSTGSPAAAHASNPPITSATLANPRSRRVAAARLDE